MERNEIELKYDFKINYLTYFTIKSGLKDFLKNFSCKGPVNFNYLRPCVPTHLKSIVSSQNGSKYVYNILKLKDNIGKSIPERTWKSILQYDAILFKAIWSIIYKVCFKAIEDNYIIWFQYKILYNILGTKNIYTNLNCIQI